ncbi:hypothetical protein BD780_003778 [Clostridium tetanomorphum]|uniref:Uncharacterized protein n=1 Tax=Clostridium tetanomorphum TaxID=1553 RepID=A0A923EDV8_CLOTT|nr:hypothetical protein [Clostridium tetanomorphum]MBC2398960.1 hypothetical protein [Clostridium tetanomorphum]MBP1866376.1 hypothetical protein [Clostridium tetanomorphum]NRS86553.1 hypothetical protein [Clostridium tetanomorphum]
MPPIAPPIKLAKIPYHSGYDKLAYISFNASGKIIVKIINDPIIHLIYPFLSILDYLL